MICTANKACALRVFCGAVERYQCHYHQPVSGERHVLTRVCAQNQQLSSTEDRRLVPFFARDGPFVYRIRLKAGRAAHQGIGWRIYFIGYRGYIPEAVERRTIAIKHRS